MVIKDKSTFQHYETASGLEWLDTNGLGGWSGASITGANTRRYHGLLVAAVKPPADRMVLLSKLDETLVINEQRIELGTNHYAEDVISPNGFNYIHSFSKDLFAEWIYEAEGVRLKKTIAMVYGENAVVIYYEVLNAKRKFSLELLPLVAARGYHTLAHQGPQMHWDASFKDDVFHNQPDGNQHLYIKVPGATYRHSPRWFNNFTYPVEKYRGLDYSEDLFNQGVFTLSLKKGDAVGIIISTTDPVQKDPYVLLANEKLRREALMNNQSENETMRFLLLAADQFIVKRDETLKTVIAGYHWFTDWGRDTMISLPGLALCTRRFEDAKKILAAFANSVSQGMLPNRFQDYGAAPEYNNVDGTLWYFIAVYKYLQSTNDKKFVLQEILPVLKNIMEWHHKGTRYHIHEQSDGLLYSGEQGVQLTWMDAKVGDWVVTPRIGKAVEIQSLWYNSLCMYVELLLLNKEIENANIYQQKAALVKKNFIQQFYNDATGCLYDVINGDVKDDAFRPNQLFAISLPFALIDNGIAGNILKMVEEKLYTPVGLRSLSPDDSHYCGVYGGDAWHRDAAYHQGTVWSWLLGPYIDAVMIVNGNEGKRKAEGIINAFKYHLSEACIGSVSEIFDGDKPHHPRGCVAQAWGVAEVIRVITEHGLFQKNNQ
ncbi:amylo-alpha-1,6-glucosidase [soil metagenome]